MGMDVVVRGHVIYGAPQVWLPPSSRHELVGTRIKTAKKEQQKGKGMDKNDDKV